MVRISLPILLTLIGLPVFSAPANAAEQPFPYQATVVTEQAEVRCGPGTQFYVTGEVKQNDMVTVHRHDHGGWYMISPPPGSFSLIEASLVEKTGGSRGVVSLASELGQGKRAVVRIGSRVSDQHSFYGRELSHGDEVTILGEKTINGPYGPVPMLMIAPPPQEFRWVKGEALIPQNQQVRQIMAADPYQIPPQHRQQLVADGRAPITSPVVPALEAPTLLAENGPKLNVPVEPKQTAERAIPIVGRPLSMPAPSIPEQIAKGENPAPTFTSPAATGRGNPDFIELAEIDREYEARTSGDPRNWRLDDVLTRYRNLEARVSDKMKVIVRQRLELAEQRHEVAERYQRFIQVSRETAQRDAELLAQQAAIEQATLQQQGGMTSGEIQQTSFETPDVNQFNQQQFAQQQQFAPQQPATPLVVPASAEMPYGQSPHQVTTPQFPTQQQHPQQPYPFQTQMQPQLQPQMATPHQAQYPPQAGMMPVPPTATPQFLPTPQQAFPRQQHMPTAGTPDAAKGGLSGAGVLHRMQGPPNVPGYVLVAPDGRILSYVSGEPGVQLDQWLGRPVGIVGKRGPDPSLGKDHIHAQQLVPVQLAP